ncbi:uncharacterized protein LOC125492897 [Beta vulgaris subsp. vulgaris]|uniref:uncharacterized protein LOC125492897 n=1 Tax=Beta vulgaris subsp. vulgaris TaxID=3555 RepID=UPI0020373514|nr:uncharacterized protein LOC125492897 [Beta vulgaris subsp. vulgaris]
MKYEERIGAAVRPQEAVDILNCMMRCGMNDLNSIGCMFTWNNKQQKDNRVFIKLDRVMVNEAWEEAFPSAAAHFMPEASFDHSPMIVNVCSQLQTYRQPFKYFTMLSSVGNFQEIVRACWNTRIEGTSMFKVVCKMKLVKKAMKKLNAEGFNDIHVVEIKALHNLSRCQADPQDDITNSVKKEAEHNANVEYRRVHKLYMSFLSQKEKLSWCKEGDENSHLFDQSIKARRIKNSAYAINDSAGEWQDEPQKVIDAFLRYYEELLGNTMADRVPVKKVVIERGPMLTKDQIQVLCRPFDVEEVNKAVGSISGEKAPGPDGFGGFFHKDTWAIIG